MSLTFATAIAGLPTAAHASHSCSSPGRLSPADTVPECVDSVGHAVACGSPGAVRLWPVNFRPASDIPLSRDSTDRVAGKTVPGAGSGHELFSSVDIVETGGAPRRLYVSYNAGVQVWDLESDPADPSKLAHRDGWQGDFLSFPPPSEVLNFLEDISAVNVSATTDFVGASAVEGVGPTLWRYNIPANGFQPLYQDTGTDGRQIRLLERTNGNVVAYVGTNEGVAIYDVSAANGLASPCLDDRGTACPTVYRGTFGSGQSRFIDVLYVPASDDVLVSVAGGLFTDLELWEVTDPRSPASAVLRFSDLTHSLGNALFEHDGHTYVAVVDEQEGLNNERLQILLIDDCLTGSNCSLAGGTVEPALTPIPISGYSTANDFLTFSRVGNTPYLHYGFATGNLQGPDLDQLWDLSLLQPPNPFPLQGLPEVTASGGSYTDPCNAETIRYWSHYYSVNAHGLNNMVPRVGMFSTDGFFYRAAATILDVHLFGTGPTADPTVVTQAVDLAPHYFEEQITFQATASNCGTGGNWAWFAGDIDAIGLGAGNALQDISWNLCSGPAPCPDKTFQVWALNSNCSGDPDLVEQRETITVEEPRPSVTDVSLSPPGSTYPVCTQLQLTANADGREPFSYTWAVTQDGDPIDSGVGNPFVWDTSGLVVVASSIFSDGFESGDISAWNQIANGAQQTAFDIEVTVSNDTAAVATQSVVVNLTPVADTAFDNPAITATNVGGSSFDFTANTTGATEWKFEIEDLGNGSSVGCEVYASCIRIDWGFSPQTSHTWEPPNNPGTYGVTAWARNCVTPQGGEVQAEIDVIVDQITEPEPPVMTVFSIHADSIPPCVNDFFFFTCPVNTSLKFQLDATGDFTEFQIDWEANGNWQSYSATSASQITHTYTTTGPRSPMPQARAFGHGNFSPPRNLFGSGLTIQ